jgi:hypothetical protein
LQLWGIKLQATITIDGNFANSNEAVIRINDALASGELTINRNGTDDKVDSFDFKRDGIDMNALSKWTREDKEMADSWLYGNSDFQNIEVSKCENGFLVTAHGQRHVFLNFKSMVKFLEAKMVKKKKTKKTKAKKKK